MPPASTGCMTAAVQISIHISHHAVKVNDRGMVVIGGTVSFGARGGGEEDTLDEEGDAVDEELNKEDDETAHSKSGAQSALVSAAGSRGSRRPAIARVACMRLARCGGTSMAPMRGAPVALVACMHSGGRRRALRWPVLHACGGERQQ
jgi:hypothetical protein